MSSAWGGPRSQARAPDKGVFPLDHFAECKAMAQQYLKCLEAHDSDASACQALSKQYLECRMQRNLMAAQDLRELGLGFEELRGEQQPQQPPQPPQQQPTQQ